jgi:hypothetical protein
MNRTIIRTICVAAVLATVGSTVPATSAAADLHHPLSGKELLVSCAAEMNTFLPVDVTLSGLRSSATLVRSYNSAAATACWNFGWAEINAPTRRFSVIPAFAGPNITSSPWDCNHSSVIYGVYGQHPTGQWSFVAGGLMYGNLADGVCGYHPGNFPSQANWSVSPTVAGARFRIGTRSWSHDDPGLSHQHNLCAHATECVWPTKVQIVMH